MSQQSQLLPEGMIQDSLSNSKLPPLWQLIYNEGILGNHLLFKNSDVVLFDEQEPAYDGSSLEEEKTMEAFQKTIVSIISKSDLADMSQIIESLSEELKVAVYVYYKRMLKAWGAYLRISLH
jgi:hypothetical protein